MTILYESSVVQYWKHTNCPPRAAATFSSDEPAALKCELGEKYLDIYCKRKKRKKVFLADSFICVV